MFCQRLLLWYPHFSHCANICLNTTLAVRYRKCKSIMSMRVLTSIKVQTCVCVCVSYRCCLSPCRRWSSSRSLCPGWPTGSWLHKINYNEKQIFISKQVPTKYVCFTTVRADMTVTAVWNQTRGSAEQLQAALNKSSQHKQTATLEAKGDATFLESIQMSFGV